MRQGQEDQVALAHRALLQRLEPAPGQPGQRGQVRVHRAHRLARVALAGDRADLQVRVPGQQPEQFAARIAAGARDRYPRAHPPSFAARP